MYKDIKYFKGLNALRFFAAYLVVIYHAEQIRLKNDIFNLKEFTLFNNGTTAVTFFFVLSGFIISYLLLKELKRTNDISISKFYMRRILRIWPLYFLVIAIGALIVPVLIGLIDYPYEMPYRFRDVILYYVFFAPFMVNILFGHHLLEPLWSIGVEELFYICWAPLFKFFKKHLLTIIFTVIASKIILLLAIRELEMSYIVTRVIKMLQFESMAIGALAAYIIYHRKNEIENSLLFSKPVQSILLTYILLRLVGMKYLGAKYVLFNYLFYTHIISNILLTVAFAWLIVSISINKRSIIKLDHKLFNFLGDISYGIYMYHMIVIFGIILVFKNHLAVMPNTVASILYYLILTAGVVLVSFASKRLFENYFLNLKRKFSLSQISTKDDRLESEVNSVK